MTHSKPSFSWFTFTTFLLFFSIHFFPSPVFLLTFFPFFFPPHFFFHLTRLCALSRVHYRLYHTMSHRVLGTKTLAQPLTPVERRMTSPSKSPLPRSLFSPGLELSLAPQHGCSYPGCHKSMTPRNGGCVECARCHQFVCNEHGKYAAGLDDSGNFTNHGTLRRVCLGCFSEKPDILRGTVAHSIDLTAQFTRIRQTSHDADELRRNKTQMRFIRLVDNSTDPETGFWEADSDVSHCRVCLVKFSWFVRKHHCRLCGRIVCDDPEGNRKFCLLMAPLGLFVSKLPNLNYSTSTNYQEMAASDTLFRCCVRCKNDLLLDWKRNHGGTDDDAVMADYELFLSQKHQISHLLQAYRDRSSQKVSTRLTTTLKDLEHFTLRFKQLHFSIDDGAMVPRPPLNPQLVQNVYQLCVILLQELLVEYRQLVEKYQDAEQEKLAQQKREQEEQLRRQNLPVDQPTLTKKEIRELREQLMVMNEQKFLVEAMVKESTKLRRFEELKSLEDNKRELEATIVELERQLGEYSF